MKEKLYLYLKVICMKLSWIYSSLSEHFLISLVRAHPCCWVWLLLLYSIPFYQYPIEYLSMLIQCHYAQLCSTNNIAAHILQYVLWCVSIHISLGSMVTRWIAVSQITYILSTADNVKRRSKVDYGTGLFLKYFMCNLNHRELFGCLVLR